MKQPQANIVRVFKVIVHCSLTILLLVSLLASTNIISGVLGCFQIDDMEISENWEEEKEEEKKEGQEDDESDKILSELSKFFFYDYRLSHSANEHEFVDHLHALDIPTPPPDLG